MTNNPTIFGKIYLDNGLDPISSIKTIGLEKTLRQSSGDFVLVLQDNGKTILAKDPLGQKIFYYGVINGSLVFGEDLQTIRSNHALEINHEVLPLFFRNGYIPTPYTIYKNLYKLFPAQIVTIDKSLNITKQTYFSPFTAEPFQGTIDEAVNQLEDLILQSISLPRVQNFATLLSGGVDSSLITALTQRHYGKQVDSFCAGFEQHSFDESHYARAIAKHLNTKHHEIVVTGKDALNVVEKLTDIYPEPLADSSQIATYLIYNKIAQSNSFAFSGDGGDELFYGYKRYDFINKIENIPFKTTIAKTLKTIDSLNIKPLIKYRQIVQSTIAALSIKNRLDRYRYFISVFKNAEPLSCCENELEYALNSPQKEIIDLEFKTMMQALDLTNYMVDDCIPKVAFASKYNGVENYAPLINSKIAKFAFSLPNSFKIFDKKGKYPLRSILYKYLPKELIDRKKMGFGVPLDLWLKQDLKEWGEDLIYSKENYKDLFNNNYIINLYNEHKNGTKDNSAHLWIVLQIFAFLRNNG